MSENSSPFEWEKVISGEVFNGDYAEFESFYEIDEEQGQDVICEYPCMYQVVLLNDDYTPMGFVVSAIQEIFNKSTQDAINIMLQVHNKEMAICGIFTRDVAETKMMHMIEYARKSSYPLECIMRKEQTYAIKKP